MSVEKTIKAKKFIVLIKPERCKGCELCIAVCPKDVLGIDEVEVNVLGYHTASVKNLNACIGCIGCGLMCPEGAIAIYREE